MTEKNIEEIIKIAAQYCKEEIPWHHHFLPLNCVFNKSDKLQLILENERTGESFVALFNYKPMKELEKLENLFFNRK